MDEYMLNIKIVRRKHKTQDDTIVDLEAAKNRYKMSCNRMFNICGVPEHELGRRKIQVNLSNCYTIRPYDSVHLHVRNLSYGFKTEYNMPTRLRVDTIEQTFRAYKLGDDMAIFVLSTLANKMDAISNKYEKLFTNFKHQIPELVAEAVLSMSDGDHRSYLHIIARTASCYIGHIKSVISTLFNQDYIDTSTRISIMTKFNTDMVEIIVGKNEDIKGQQTIEVKVLCQTLSHLINLIKSLSLSELRNDVDRFIKMASNNNLINYITSQINNIKNSLISATTSIDK